jgi:HNH endonuclease
MPISETALSIFDNEPQRRTLGIREKAILWRTAGKKCEGCGCELDFDNMQVGHKTAFSRGGSTSLRNSICLCYGCNKRQGTDSWSTYTRKMGIQTKEGKSKSDLSKLAIQELKILAKKHNVKVRGSIVDDFLDSYRAAPTKKQYINALSKVVSDSDIQSVKSLKPAKKKRRRNADSWSIW